jgi:hypothetical protein
VELDGVPVEISNLDLLAESTSAQAERLGDLADLADLGARLVQGGEGRADRPSSVRNARQSGCQGVLEDPKAFALIRLAAEPFAKLGRAAPPNVLESNMCIRDLSRSKAEESGGTSGPEVGTDDRGMLLGVDLEGRAVAAGHDRTPKATTSLARCQRAVYPEFVFVEVDHQLDGAARDDRLAFVRRGIGQGPQVTHERI